MAQQRKTERIFARIPIRVRGQNRSGKDFSEDTITVVISRDGARFALNETPEVDSTLEVTNLANNFSALVSVIDACSQSYSGLPEWGAKFSVPVGDFWDISFREREDSQLVVSALLCCRTCGRKELTNLTTTEYETLGDELSVSRLCSACGVMAQWEVEASEEEIPASVATAPTTEEPVAEPGAERRRARRLSLKVPVLVAAAPESTELTQTEDLSKTGMSFLCSLNLEIGAQVQVTIGHGLSETPAVRTCRVMWRRPHVGGERQRYGVRFADVEPAPM